MKRTVAGLPRVGQATICSSKPLANAIANTRFAACGKKTLYARIAPTKPVEPFMLSHFMHRFPRYTIVLESKRGTYSGCLAEGWYLIEKGDTTGSKRAGAHDAIATVGFHYLESQRYDCTTQQTLVD